MYSEQVHAGENLHIKSWWENLGVAPIYYKYPLAFRLKGETNSYILKSKQDITRWLPGDIVFSEGLTIPQNAVAGNYMLQTAIIGRFDDNPAIKFANENRNSDGWYDIATVVVK
jgi:hypothetical protein